MLLGSKNSDNKQSNDNFKEVKFNKKTYLIDKNNCVYKKNTIHSENFNEELEEEDNSVTSLGNSCVCFELLFRIFIFKLNLKYYKFIANLMLMNGRL